MNLQETWEESDTRTPMVCFLSMGSDPTNNIESLAKRLKLGENLLLFHIPDILGGGFTQSSLTGAQTPVRVEEGKRQNSKNYSQMVVYFHDS